MPVPQAPLGPKEMANAVREMLSAAGVPIDLERTGLLERSLDLQGQLSSVSTKLSTTEKASCIWLSSAPVPANLLEMCREGQC